MLPGRGEYDIRGLRFRKLQERSWRVTKCFKSNWFFSLESRLKHKPASGACADADCFSYLVSKSRAIP
jgi:hypothetical protein